jgi:hypothetical protein
MGKKKRGNYNQDHFKLGGSMQPGGDIVQERQKGKVGRKSSVPGGQSTDARRQTPVDRRPTDD